MIKKAYEYEDIGSIDFLQNADNVYRTPEFIVKQKISLSWNDKCEVHTVSDDTYFVRTPKRDAQFDSIFSIRENVDGRRVKSGAYTRTYKE